jgi:hypothetical protein
MAEHPTKHELDDYCRRVLTPAAFLSVHRHVTACPRCAAQCDQPQDLARDLEHLRAALLSAPDDTPYHLSAAEVAAYLRGELAEIDLEIAESHLVTCTACQSEVQPRAAVGQPIAPVRVASAAFERRRRIIFPLMNGWRPWRVAAVVAGGAALLLLTLLLLRTQTIDRREQAVQPLNLSSPQSSPAAVAQGSSAPEVVRNDADETSGTLPTEQGALPDTQFALVLNDGGQSVTLDRQGTLAGLELLPARVQQKVQAALRAGRLEQPAVLAELNGRPSTLLSESGDGLPFQLLGPVGEVVRNAQPTFRWRALAGAQSYTVTVTDADLNEVATSPPLSIPVWRMSQPLRQGVIYSWQVTALKDGATITTPVLPAPQAKFKVLDRATAQGLQQSERAYPGSHLTLGVLYAEAGLLSEAEQELRALVRTNPRARIARELLRSIQAVRAARTSLSGHR